MTRVSEIKILHRHRFDKLNHGLNEMECVAGLSGSRSKLPSSEARERITGASSAEPQASMPERSRPGAWWTTWTWRAGARTWQD